MSFRISGLPLASFGHLFGLPDDELARRGAIRYVADSKPGYPDRIELRDAEVGESVLLVNYLHQPADTPYRASHAVFVLESARTAFDRVDDVPPTFRSRTLSLRAFDDRHMMIDAELCAGQDVEAVIEQFWRDRRVAYLQAHYAKRGCYAARIDRVQ
jgi:hypothetical protein